MGASISLRVCTVRLLLIWNFTVRIWQKRTIFTLRSIPNEHMTFIQRRINVDATSWRCIDVYATSYKRHVPAGFLPIRHFDFVRFHLAPGLHVVLTRLTIWDIRAFTTTTGITLIVLVFPLYNILLSLTTQDTVYFCQTGSEMILLCFRHLSESRFCKSPWKNVADLCGRGLNPRSPGLQSDGASNWATEVGTKYLYYSNCIHQTMALNLILG